MYPKDTEKWKQFTTGRNNNWFLFWLFCIPKILKNESNSQRHFITAFLHAGCFVSQRYWKMKAIHNLILMRVTTQMVVLYPKDTEKWKQFTTVTLALCLAFELFCIPKILKNESNSQHYSFIFIFGSSCFVSQRYWKMKAIHNWFYELSCQCQVVLYPKDTEKWKQFTTRPLLIYP